MNKRVAIALSGGVDSAVAANLLREDGYDVIAITLLLCSDEATEAALIADKLQIEHHIIDLLRHFDKEVIKPFLADYAALRTPNPCCLCNRQIKFGLLWQEAQKLGANFMATGHYTRLSHDENGYHLWRGFDKKKDQSYFLSALSQEQLSHSLFPLGELTKSEVKRMAKDLGITPADNESQDICFVKGSLREYLKANLKMAKGPIFNQHGRLIGEHEGLPLYTVGQRQGLGVASSCRLFIKQLNSSDNSIVLAPRNELQAHKVWAEEINWVGGKPSINDNLSAQIRYGAIAQEVFLTNDFDRIRADFTQSVFAPACGQYMVFYNNDEVLGGGQICGFM